MVTIERVERVLAEMPECDKLNDRRDEWNALYQFVEWLQEKGILLSHRITMREFYGEEYEDEPMDTLVPIPRTLENLFYEYFDLDPAELEQERRRLLSTLREVSG